jgi:hypothetical protein
MIQAFVFPFYTCTLVPGQWFDPLWLEVILSLYIGFGWLGLLLVLRERKLRFFKGLNEVVN